MLLLETPAVVDELIGERLALSWFLVFKRRWNSYCLSFSGIKYYYVLRTVQTLEGILFSPLDSSALFFGPINKVFF